MRFAIVNKLPYMVSAGVAYPVEIKGNTVRYEEKGSFAYDGEGVYTLAEITAKCSKLTSIKRTAKKKTEG